MLSAAAAANAAYLLHQHGGHQRQSPSLVPPGTSDPIGAIIESIAAPASRQANSIRDLIDDNADMRPETMPDVPSDADANTATGSFTSPVTEDEQ